MKIEQKQNLIRIASLLCWVLGALTFLVLVAILIPVLAKARLQAAWPFLALLLVVAVLYGVGAWGLHKTSRWAGILVAVLTGLTLAMNILAMATNSRRDIIGFIVNGAIFVLIILAWKALR